MSSFSGNRFVQIQQRSGRRQRIEPFQDRDLRRIGLVVTGGIALVILLFALLLARRRPPDPNV